MEPTRQTRRLRFIIGAMGLAWAIYGANTLWNSYGLAWRQRIAVRQMHYSGCMCDDCIQNILKVPVRQPWTQVEVGWLDWTGQSIGDPLTVSVVIIASGTLLILFAVFGISPIQRLALALNSGPFRCANCGYDLVGIPLSNPCPECGKPRVS